MLFDLYSSQVIAVKPLAGLHFYAAGHGQPCSQSGGKDQRTGTQQEIGAGEDNGGVLSGKPGK